MADLQRLSVGRVSGIRDQSRKRNMRGFTFRLWPRVEGCLCRSSLLLIDRIECLFQVYFTIVSYGANLEYFLYNFDSVLELEIYYWSLYASSVWNLYTGTRLPHHVPVWLHRTQRRLPSISTPKPSLPSSRVICSAALTRSYVMSSPTTLSFL